MWRKSLEKEDNTDLEEDRAGSQSGSRVQVGHQVSGSLVKEEIPLSPIKLSPRHHPTKLDDNDNRNIIYYTI